MAQFVLALLLGLALLTWAASSVVQTTARGWFERDVSSQGRLVLIGARPSLLNAWDSDPEVLREQLRNLTRGERVLGAAVCDNDLNILAETAGFPEELACWAVARRPGDGRDSESETWDTVATLPTGRVQISAISLTRDNEPIGFAVLLHDLSYIERREAQARNFVSIGFVVLAFMAFGVPMVAVRWARGMWSSELRGLLRGEAAKTQEFQRRREFQPILSDVRELVNRTSLRIG